MAKRQKRGGGGSRKIGNQQIDCQAYFNNRTRIRNARIRLERAIRKMIKRYAKLGKPLSMPGSFREKIINRNPIGRKKEISA